jgi:heme exporter protein D
MCCIKFPAYRIFLDAPPQRQSFRSNVIRSSARSTQASRIACCGACDYLECHDTDGFRRYRPVPRADRADLAVVRDGDRRFADNRVDTAAHATPGLSAARHRRWVAARLANAANRRAAGMNMLSSLGPYAPFIVTSYGLVTVVVLILIVWVAVDYRRQKRRLRDLEASGVIRRSGRGATEIS